MKKRPWGFLIAVLVSVLPIQAREIVFIGFTGQSAPAMKVHFNRVFQERLESAAPDIRLVNNPETERLRLQLGDLDYTSIAASLASSLKRCAGDSALIVWGSVKDVSFRILRKKIIKKEICGQLTLELALYDPRSQLYVYSGEIAESLKVDKGYTVEFGDLERTDQIPAVERERLTDSLQILASVRSAAILVERLQNYNPPADSAKPTPAKAADASAPAKSGAADSARSGRPGAADSTKPGTAAISRVSKPAAADTAKPGKPGAAADAVRVSKPAAADTVMAGKPAAAVPPKGQAGTAIPPSSGTRDSTAAARPANSGSK